jgi:hypothetical protein
VSIAVNGTTGKVLHKKVTDGLIYFGTVAQPGDVEETPSIRHGGRYALAMVRRHNVSSIVSVPLLRSASADSFSAISFFVPDVRRMMFNRMYKN